MSSIPAHLKELLKNLEFIAMFEKGKKPCLSDMTFVDADSILGAYKRYQKGESKKQLLGFIDAVVDQTFVQLLDHRNREYVVDIIKSICRAKIGISNTESTYQDHPLFVTSVRVVLNNIDHQLAKYQGGGVPQTYSDPRSTTWFDQVAGYDESKKYD